MSRLILTCAAIMICCGCKTQPQGDPFLNRTTIPPPATNLPVRPAGPAPYYTPANNSRPPAMQNYSGPIAPANVPPSLPAGSYAAPFNYNGPAPAGSTPPTSTYIPPSGPGYPAPGYSAPPYPAPAYPNNNGFTPNTSAPAGGGFPGSVPFNSQPAQPGFGTTGPAAQPYWSGGNSSAAPGSPWPNTNFNGSPFNGPPTSPWGTTPVSAPANPNSSGYNGYPASNSGANPNTFTNSSPNWQLPGGWPQPQLQPSGPANSSVYASAPYPNNGGAPVYPNANNANVSANGGYATAAPSPSYTWAANNNSVTSNPFGTGPVAPVANNATNGGSGWPNFSAPVATRVPDTAVVREFGPRAGNGVSSYPISATAPSVPSAPPEPLRLENNEKPIDFFELPPAGSLNRRTSYQRPTDL